MPEDSTLFPLPKSLNNNLGGARDYARHYASTILICTVIAAILWATGSGEFISSWIFSLCIGLSVHTLTVAGIKLINPDGIWRLWIVSVPLGVFAGLALGAFLNGIPLESIFQGGSPLMSLVISLIATYVFYSYYSMIEMRDLLREQELTHLTSEKQLAETRLRLLQSQIEPHFLFNTLSHVVSLIGTDAARAELMLQKLTQFLRVSLRRSRSDTATLQDEIDLVSNYLAILKIRWDDRLTYRIDVNTDAAAIRFPPLLLQPLVENAIVHGLEPLEQGGTVLVSVKTDPTRLILTVSDTGAGLGEGKGAIGMGLGNVRERLRVLFGPDAHMTFADVTPHGLAVTVSIPVSRLQHE